MMLLILLSLTMFSCKSMPNKDVEGRTTDFSESKTRDINENRVRDISEDSINVNSKNASLSLEDLDDEEDVVLFVPESGLSPDYAVENIDHIKYISTSEYRGDLVCSSGYLVPQPTLETYTQNGIVVENPHIYRSGNLLSEHVYAEIADNNYMNTIDGTTTIDRSFVPVREVVLDSYLRSSVAPQETYTQNGVVVESPYRHKSDNLLSEHIYAEIADNNYMNTIDGTTTIDRSFAPVREVSHIDLVTSNVADQEFTNRDSIWMDVNSGHRHNEHRHSEHPHSVDLYNNMSSCFSDSDSSEVWDSDDSEVWNSEEIENDELEDEELEDDEVEGEELGVVVEDSGKRVGKWIKMKAKKALNRVKKRATAWKKNSSAVVNNWRYRDATVSGIHTIDELIRLSQDS